MLSAAELRDAADPDVAGFFFELGSVGVVATSGAGTGAGVSGCSFGPRKSRMTCSFRLTGGTGFATTVGAALTISGLGAEDGCHILLEETSGEPGDAQ